MKGNQKRAGSVSDGIIPSLTLPARSHALISGVHLAAGVCPAATSAAAAIWAAAVWSPAAVLVPGGVVVGGCVPGVIGLPVWPPGCVPVAPPDAAALAGA